MEPYRRTRAFLDPNDALTTRSGQVYDPAIMGFRAQRMGSIGSSTSSMSWDSSSYDVNSLRSSISSYESFMTAQSINSTYQANAALLPSQRPSYTTQRRLRSTAPPPPVFQRLPSEIYDCILRKLREFHENPSSLSCQTCYLRDLCSLALTSRAWDKAVRVRLYERIYIIGSDHKDQMKKHKMKFGVRLKLLRRTLRERRVLAAHVHELKVPRLQPDEESIRKEIIDLTASIVMACPNLEKLLGFYPIYGHEFDRLIYALSSRRKLKEHIWIIGENAAITQRSTKQLPPGLMDREQVEGFLISHVAWMSLTTLFLHSHNQGILEREVLIETLHILPSLQHLCISSFHTDDFDDNILLRLPPLESLRLQDLEGVTFWGLSDFSRTTAAHCIKRLSLINLDITYLSAVSNLLLHLNLLERFTLVQESPPEVASGELVFQPIIASGQLKFMHWDISKPGSANENLASSIRANGFPNLHTLRAPSDHYGLLQALCKPRAQIEYPRDKYRGAQRLGLSSPLDPLNRNLVDARRQAQQRIEEAQKTVVFKVIVEEDGVVEQVYDLNGFMGTIGSKIAYSLDPDMHGSDDAVIDFPDLTSGKAEGTVRRDHGCRGLWNASDHGGKKWWEHEERYRYQPIELKKFF